MVVDELSDPVKQKIQDRLNEYQNEVRDGGRMVFGRLLPPTENFIKVRQDWCVHDCVNMAVDDLRGVTN